MNQSKKCFNCGMYMMETEISILGVVLHYECPNCGDIHDPSFPLPPEAHMEYKWPVVTPPTDDTDESDPLPIFGPKDECYLCPDCLGSGLNDDDATGCETCEGMGRKWWDEWGGDE